MDLLPENLCGDASISHDATHLAGNPLKALLQSNGIKQLLCDMMKVLLSAIIESFDRPTTDQPTNRETNRLT